ncbi:hypothetical protein M114_0419 [Bacteroides fragilis str. 3986 N(B)22]|nr:hypothetical protein M114_0419 [Bacteroides fragilis str. 3986 N(B)22]
MIASTFHLWEGSNHWIYSLIFIVYTLCFMQRKGFSFIKDVIQITFAKENNILNR